MKILGSSFFGRRVVFGLHIALDLPGKRDEGILSFSG
jgi:hypothetical protein